MSCPGTLRADESVASVPEVLKPVPEIIKDVPVVPIGSSENFFCTDRPGAEKIAVTFRENSDCHSQLATMTSSQPDWVITGLSFLLGIGVGVAIFH